MGKIEHDAAGVIERWNEFKASDLPAFNRQLHDAHLAEIRLESNLSHAEPQTDEE